jgi:hypothetical protein
MEPSKPEMDGFEKLVQACSNNQWIGLRENLQETIDFPIDNRFALTQFGCQIFTLILFA